MTRRRKYAIGTPKSGGPRDNQFLKENGNPVALRAWGPGSTARPSVVGRHNGVMARRKRDRIGRQLPVTAPRQQSHRSHWRADGAPKTAYRSQSDALSVADERRMDAGVELNVYAASLLGMARRQPKGTRGLTAENGTKELDDGTSVKP